jgi:hypothetical protein
VRSESIRATSGEEKGQALQAQNGDRCSTLALEPASTRPLGNSLQGLATADHALEPAAEPLNRHLSFGMDSSVLAPLLADVR